MSDKYLDGVAAPADSSVWSFSPLREALPEGLPPGGLTCLVLPAHEGIRTGAWSSLVGQAVLETVDHCRPVVYVFANRQYGWGPTDGWNPLGPHYREVLDWTAEQACCEAGRTAMWGDVSERPSTLTVLCEALEEHEDMYGPALVVVDGARMARPYNQWRVVPTDDDFLTLPAVDESIARSTARRRAKDLLSFAVARRDAPTVVVWHRNRDNHDFGLAALRASSLVVIEAEPSSYGRPVSVAVTARRDVEGEFAHQVRRVLPRLEWGFDLSDLEPDQEE
ncbi:hypothetical protein [Geodermatophilus sp. SYSU D01176]